jgi:GTP-binding protein Era
VVAGALEWPRGKECSSVHQHRDRPKLHPLKSRMTEKHSTFHAGLAVLVGRTNAGKSTLLNALVGSKVSIVTPRPQTTREAIHGVVNRPQGQVVFVDTPGFFKTHASALVETLHKRAKEALADVDVIVHVADPTRPIGEEDEIVLAVLAKQAKPKILCLNKSDQPYRRYRSPWFMKQKEYAAVVEVSAIDRLNLDALVQEIIKHLPVGPALYPPEQVSNATREFTFAEIIREQIYLQTGEEVPYRTKVELDAIEETTNAGGKPLLRVKATILTPSDRYQRMLIGAKARMVKSLRLGAQSQLRKLAGKKVALDLEVLVDEKMLK